MANMNYERDRKSSESIYELIDSYKREAGVDTAYEVERFIGVNGHDVAWVKTVTEGRDDPRYYLYCACDFAENVGWERDGDEIFDLPGSDDCREVQAALHLRQLELRDEYTRAFLALGEVRDYYDETILTNYIPEIIMDLIDRQARGDFIGSLGSYIPGGFVWPETVADIIGISMEEAIGIADDMERAGMVFVDGSAIRPISAKDIDEDYSDKDI